MIDKWHTLLKASLAMFLILFRGCVWSEWSLASHPHLGGAWPQGYGDQSLHGAHMGDRSEQIRLIVTAHTTHTHTTHQEYNALT